MAVIALLLAGSGYAQTEISYSQLIKNPVWINPAVQGLHKGVSLDLAYRRQWEGFEGAPKTMGFNLNNSFDKIHLGIGVDGHFEEVGLRKNRRFGVIFCYKNERRRRKLTAFISESRSHCER